MHLVDEILPKDCRFLSQHARPEDRMEWEEAIGRPLYWALWNAVDISPYRQMLSIHGAQDLPGYSDPRPFAMWGAHDTDTRGVGQVWFIASTEATRHVHKIHSLWNREMEALHKRWPMLVCYTHRDNHLHHTWLARRGFELDREMKLGPRGVTYYTYSRRAPQCADQPSRS